MRQKFEARKHKKPAVVQQEHSCGTAGTHRKPAGMAGAETFRKPAVDFSKQKHTRSHL